MRSTSSRPFPRIRRSTRTGVLALAGVTCLVAGLLVPTAASANPAGGRFTARAVPVASTVVAAKSASGKRAISDKALLRRTDSRRVNVMVKLDYDPTASYTGGLRHLPATSPRVTGRKLTGRSSAERAYDGYAKRFEARFRSALARRLPAAVAGASLRRVYGGLAVTLPANQAKTLLTLPGVVAVQADALRHVDSHGTVESPQFIGAPTIWKQEGGQQLAGKGVIFADLDTGVWPEHPMLADNPALGTPPGPARQCNFGDNPLTPANDPFHCNHKLIGGYAFTQTYDANNSDDIYAGTARDADGHGTHTSTTAAGDAVASAPIFGVDRGPVSGVAPGAWVIEYKVCGPAGCYNSDSVAAIQQAVVDGANVINFSISGGASPYSDPVELAFLDAYNAGVFVAASAGNSGPGAGTTDHRGPWVTTVAASTQSRQFQTTLQLTSGADIASFVGTSLTRGAGPAPVVLSSAAPYSSQYCDAPAPPGVFAGKIVACQRGGPLGTGRAQKGFNVKQGGAVGMILYNMPLAETESDNHWLPAVHLADGTAFLAFMNSHGAVTGSFATGVKANGQGDVMAAFSSRGPGGQFLKPDITAPGVQVLAGNTPTPTDVASGPPGEYYQAIAGTSMSSPHIAGSALLVKALHPTWTPGEIKSALMTTATTKVVKQDLTTPADPFDMGAGRVDLTRAGDAPIVFDETAARMVALGKNPLTAINLNLPSVNVPTMPGTVSVTRTATNVSGHAYRFHVRTTSPAGASISVTPRHGVIPAGGTRTFTITITSDAPAGQYFGQLTFRSHRGPDVHLPVAFANAQGDVTLAQSCTPASIAKGATTTCTVNVQNNAGADAAVVATTQVDHGLRIVSGTNARVAPGGRSATAGPVTLAAPKDAVPAIAPGTSPAGYLPLSAFGIAATPIGDEAAQNYNVPAFSFGGKQYTGIGVVSDGYLVLNGSQGNDDIAFAPQNLPDPARPNGVLAPYWTDLDGTGAPGISVGTLTDGVNSWIVVQWEVHVYGDTSAARDMQVWIGTGSAEDITYTYDPATTIGKDALGQPYTIGVENVTGTAGAQIAGPPTGDYRVTTTPGQPGGSLSYSLVVKGEQRGTSAVTTTMDSDAVAGDTRVSTPVVVH